jgi:dolichyl-phosphate-mannose--protein O-mannosyl transferase
VGAAGGGGGTVTAGATAGAPAGRRGHALLAPLLLATLALALSLPRLTTPDVYVFDELYYAYTAGKYVAGEEAYSTAVLPREDPALEWTHPPLAKLLIAGGILLGGDNPLGWRIVSALFGALGVVAAYLLALALTGNRVTAMVAGGLLLLDGLYLVESRTGMSNLFLLVFTNAALLGLARVLTAAPERMGPPLLATGLALGLAIATKWSAIALAGLIGVVVVGRIALLWWRAAKTGETETAQTRAGLLAALGWAAAALILVPLTVYFASYLHFFSTGHGWGDFLQLHRDMLAYHRELGTVHDDSSPWWQWPLAARGVWYYVAAGRGEIAAVFGNGNPLLYWPMAIAVAWVAIDWWGRRPLAWLVLVVGFFGQWLPWALSPRGTFVYHFLPVVPLGCMALAVILTGAWREGGIRRGAAALYVAAVIATFVFFYPIYTAVPLDPQQMDLRMWLPSWR